MKTITGNEVRKPLALFGKAVKSYAEACAGVGFTIIDEPAARLSTGLAIPNTKNLYRSDTGFCLGQHTPQFTYLQPCDSLKTLERARELIGGEWLSVSCPKNGKQLSGFIGIEHKITAPKRGDQIGLSVGFFDFFGGQGRTRLGLFANVLACNNGMTAQKSLLEFSEKHIGSLVARFAAMEFNLHIRLQDQIAEMQNTVNALDNMPMTGNEVESFARQLFPATDEADVSPRVRTMREAIAVGFVRGTGNVGRTRWDAFNAVTEWLDWQSSNRETEFSREDNRFESLTVGNGAKTRARALELLTA
jgi:uncharacterized protein DUF932